MLAPAPSLCIDFLQGSYETLTRISAAPRICSVWGMNSASGCSRAAPPAGPGPSINVLRAMNAWLFQIAFCVHAVTDRLRRACLGSSGRRPAAQIQHAISKAHAARACSQCQTLCAQCATRVHVGTASRPPCCAWRAHAARARSVKRIARNVPPVGYV